MPKTKLQSFLSGSSSEEIGDFYATETLFSYQYLCDGRKKYLSIEKSLCVIFEPVCLQMTCLSLFQAVSLVLRDLSVLWLSTPTGVSGQCLRMRKIKMHSSLK